MVRCSATPDAAKLEHVEAVAGYASELGRHVTRPGRSRSVRFPKLPSEYEKSTAGSPGFSDAFTDGSPPSNHALAAPSPRYTWWPSICRLVLAASGSAAGRYRPH